MVRIYKTRKNKRKKRITRKNKVFRKKKKHTKKRNIKKNNRKRNNRKRRTKKGGEVRRRGPAAATVRVANKWVPGIYGTYFRDPYFVNWPNPPGPRQWGSTSVAVRFRNLPANGGRVHLYGTAIPWQGRNIGDIRHPINWAPPGGLRQASRMYRQMAYFVYNKGVKKWISHQACAMPAAFPHHFFYDADIPGCQGNPTGGPVSPANIDPGFFGAYGTAIQRRNAARAEDNTWGLVRNRYTAAAAAAGPHGPGIRIDPSWRPVFNMYIQDMTVGRVPVWGMINQMGGFWDARQSSVVHCLAGWGRTGATLFYHIWRNWFSYTRANNGVQDTVRARLAQPFLGFANSMALYDNLRILANSSLILDDMHIDNGTVQGPLPARINNAHPIDRHIESPNPPAGRPANGDWEGIGTYGRTSDLVHEVFALYGRGGNFCADIFISRINIMIIHLWVYLYLTNFPGSAPVTRRFPAGAPGAPAGYQGWDRVYLYRKPSGPRAGGGWGVPGWPDGGALDRTSPRDIFGRGSIQIVHMAQVCARAGYAIGGYGGHITKPIPQMPAGVAVQPAAAFNALFGIHF